MELFRGEPFSEKHYEEIKKRVRNYLLKEYYDGYPIDLFNEIGSEGDHNTRHFVKRAVAELLNHKEDEDETC